MDVDLLFVYIAFTAFFVALFLIVDNLARASGHPDRLRKFADAAVLASFFTVWVADGADVIRIAFPAVFFVALGYGTHRLVRALDPPGLWRFALNAAVMLVVFSFWASVRPFFFTQFVAICALALLLVVSLRPSRFRALWPSDVSFPAFLLAAFGTVAAQDALWFKFLAYWDDKHAYAVVLAAVALLAYRLLKRAIFAHPLEKVKISGR